MDRKHTLLRPRRSWLVLPALVLLAGCSRDSQAARFGLPESASDRATHIGDLYFWAWVVALAVGVLVWGLIGWVAFRYRRRRSDNYTPRQTRYNLPMEIMYTLVPVLIVAVLFVFTSQTEHKVVAKSEQPPPHVIDVVGQKWSWTFNYQEAQSGGVDVWEAGTIERTPDLYLPVNETVRFNLESPDVIHSFWIPEFYYKLDVIPGRHNSFDATPTREGTFVGKCAELCGTYHSAMLFNVHVVSRAEYDAHLRSLEQAGQTGKATLPTGGTRLVTPAPAAGEARKEGTR